MRTMPQAAAPDHPSNKTVVSAAYDRLREDIMTGVLEPGRKLKFCALSGVYGAGVGTLREALHKLTADGLVEAEERRGFTVEQLSAEQLSDACSIRILLEEEGLRRSIRMGNIEWEVGVLGTFRRLEHLSDIADKNAHALDGRWQDCHRDFHRALISACNSPVLLELRDIVFARQERYSRLFLSNDIHDAAELMNNMKEHRGIKEAALARGEDRAALLLRRHLEGTQSRLLKWLAGRREKVPAHKRRSGRNVR
jgi:GntR family transcriptional regulator, carbon starvation induced regulator